MKTKEFLEALNVCITDYYDRLGEVEGYRYFNTEKYHIDPNYPVNDKRFTQGLNKAIKEYVDGEYYQSLIKASKLHKKSYAKRTNKQS